MVEPTPIIPIIPVVDARQHERRSDWHTPQDCFKLFDVQTAMTGVTERLDKGQNRMDKIELTIKNLDNKIESNNTDTAEILEIVKAGRGFFKVMGWIMKGIGWTASIAAPIVGLYFALKDSVHK